MEFHTLSRKELQTLCKSHGIPANKSNQFMAEALAKKRVPLSTKDANRGQNNDAATGNFVKNNDLARDTLKAQKDIKYTNNLLTRGKRKDVGAVPSSLDSTTSANGRMVDKRVIPKTESVKAASQEKENVRMECGVLPSSKVNLTRAEKDNIADKVRSQIEASLRTKVGNAAPMRLPEPLLQTSCKGTGELSNARGTVKTDVKGGGNDGLNFSLVDNERQERNAPSPTRLPPGSGMIVTSISPSATKDGEEQTQSCPSPVSSPLKVTLSKDDTLFSSDLGHGETLDLIASPALRLSPLQRIEQNILSIVNKAKNFWNPGSSVS